MTTVARSWLFTPATRPERFARANDVGADVLVIDLEDAVVAADKLAARTSALTYLASAPCGRIRRALRVNGLDCVHGLADLLAIVEARMRFDFLVVPKTESADHILLIDRLLAQGGIDARIVALVESARGLAAVEDIASASPRLAAVMFGAADMAADLGARVNWHSLYHARARIVAACAVASVAAIDSPWFDIRDPAGLHREVRRGVDLGFTGKAAIHPTQIEPINARLTPGAAEVAHAQAVLVANRAGVGVVDGMMIDEAVARRARRILAAAGISATPDDYTTETASA